MPVELLALREVGLRRANRSIRPWLPINRTHLLQTILNPRQFSRTLMSEENRWS
jgi:hypothetical protein